MRNDTKNLTRSQRLDIYAKELIGRKTDAEIAFERILNELNIHYEAQKPLLLANAITDYYIPFLNMCYEIDGEYHEYRTHRDSIRARRIRNNCNIGVSRIKNFDVLNNPEQVKIRIVKHMENKE